MKKHLIIIVSIFFLLLGDASANPLQWVVSGGSVASGIGGIDANTVLMLDMEGEDEGQVWTDTSSSNHTITHGGSTKTENTQTKFGSTSTFFNEDGYLNVADSADWDLGTGDFTIDFWYYSDVANIGFESNYIFDLGAERIYATIGSVNVGVGQYSTFYVGGGEIREGTGAEDEWPSNTWTHIALERVSGEVYGYINGVQEGTVSDANDFDTITVFRIGDRYIHQAGGNFYDGYIDEFRFSNVARTQDADDPLYNGGTPGDSFTPPTEAYTTE